MSERAPGPAGRPRILFTTSNGTGLGHLTRSMAIARRLADRAEPLFVTLSAAAPVVERMGFPVEYVPAYATPASGNDYRWSRRLRARLRAVIAEAEPAVIVFDGTHPYEALLGALPADATPVWCRRPLWKRGSSRVPLGRAGAFDAVLEPGELAAAEDAGPTVALRDRAHRVEPIVLLDRAELLPRAEAAAALGLDPEVPTVLVSLGQGAEVRDATRRALSVLAARGGVQVAALSSALAAAGSVPEGVVELRATYPMSRYFAAFDAAVAAAGYNAYHELIALGVPSLFVPMARDTDDQPARARHAERAGIGLGAEGPADPELEARLERLLDPGERAALAARLAELPEPGGAAEAADWLAGLAEPSGPAGPGRRQAPTGGKRCVVHRNPPVAPGGARGRGTFGGGGGPSSSACRRRRGGSGARRSPSRGCGRWCSRSGSSPSGWWMPPGPRSPRRARSRGGRWSSPTRSRRSASCARSGPGSSTSRRPPRARRSSPECPTSASSPPAWR